MKKQTLTIAVTTLLLFLVAACGPNKDEMNANATATIEAVHTRVAITLTAQAAMFTPTSQVLPTQTMVPTATASPTLSAVATATTAIGLPVQNKADSATYMADVTIPDDMVIAPGTAFTKTWQMYNNGSTTWTTEYKLAYVNGEAMSGVDTKLSQSVAPNSSANVSINMVAPTTPGTYTGYWKLKNTAGTFFGDQISIRIIVSNGTAVVTTTPDPNATATSEPAWVSYVIVDGDSCESIALAHNTTWAVIKTYNNLAEYCSVDNFANHIGETIKVPEW